MQLAERPSRPDDCSTCGGTGWLTTTHFGASGCPDCNPRALEPEAYERRRSRQRDFDARQHEMVEKETGLPRGRRSPR
jgi:hypothetical protein